MTKPSSSISRKPISGSKHFKLSLIRRKLTLKRPKSPVQFVVDIQQEDPEGGTNEGGEPLNEQNMEGDQPVALSQAKATSKKTFQRASPMKLVSLYPNISIDQQTLIRKAHYGGLLDIKCSKLQPELCKFFMESFDPVSTQMVFPGRGEIPVTEASVKKVIGVPRGKIEMKYEVNTEATRFMREQFGNGVRKQPTITELKNKLVSIKNADRKYLRLFITFVMCSVLAPTTAVRISPRLYPSLVNIKQANNLNVCKFVIMMIRKATKSSSEKAIMKSCMLYLMVKYLDSLQLRDLHVSEEGTRVAVWTNAMVKEAIKQDTRSDGTFGAAPLKPEFRDTELTAAESGREDDREQSPNVTNEVEDDFTEDTPNEEARADHPTPNEEAQVAQEGDHCAQSILFSDEKINEFINTFAPSDRTEKDTSTYKEAILQACYGFETGMQAMLTNLTQKSVKQTKGRKRKILAGRGRKNGVPDRSEEPVDEQKNEDVHQDHGEQPMSSNGETVHPTGAVEYQQGFDDEDGGMDSEGHLKEQEDGSFQEAAAEPQICTKSAQHASNFTSNGQESGLDENSNPDSVASLLADFAKLNANKAGTRKATLPSHPKPMHGEDSDDEGTQEIYGFQGSNRRAQFLAYALGPTVHKPEFDIPEMEPPVFLDIGNTISTRKMMKDLVQAEPRNEDDSEKLGLESWLNGTLRPEYEKILSDMVPKPEPRKRKRVTFADEQESEGQLAETITSDSPSRYRTRSASRAEAKNSPIKEGTAKEVPSGANETAKAISPRKSPRQQVVSSPTKIAANNVEPRRSPRLHGGPAQMKARTETRTSRLSSESNSTRDEDSSAPKLTRTTPPSSANHDPMNRKLVFDSTESERLARRQKAMLLAPDAPPFDLDTPPDDETTQVVDGFHQDDAQAGCSKGSGDPGAASTSIMAHEYQKRVVKLGRYQRSPFIDYELKKCYNASQKHKDLYTMVCEHAGKSPENRNTEHAVDLDSYFITIADLADSVAPRRKLLNVVAEVGIQIIREENKNEKKFVMPLRVASYLIEGRFDLKDVTRCFATEGPDRLDQKDTICFPTLRCSAACLLENLATTG